MIALFVTFALFLWAVVNTTIWNLTATSVLKADPFARRPFHWTVLVGPFAYYPWLSRWEKANAMQPGIANLTPPALAEISTNPRIPLDVDLGDFAAKLGARRFAEGGPVRRDVVWLNEYGTMRYPEPRHTTISSFAPRDAQPGDVWHDTSGEGPMSGAHVITTTGIDPGWIPPPASLDPPRPTGCQHPNPVPVVLTTDEVVAGVCPDCLRPLPPASVGSEWKP